MDNGDNLYGLLCALVHRTSHTQAQLLFIAHLRSKYKYLHVAGEDADVPPGRLNDTEVAKSGFEPEVVASQSHVLFPRLPSAYASRREAH